MALTLTGITLAGVAGSPVPTVEGQHRRARAKVTFDSAYPTGGYVLTPAMFGFGDGVVYVSAGVSAAGRPVAFVPATGALKVFSAVSTEIGNGVDLSADSVVVEAVGF